MIIAQVRAIFKLPREYDDLEMLLAYIEWFTPFSVPVADLGVYSIMCLTCCQRHNVAIIPVTNVEQIVHLLPKFGHCMNVHWHMDDVLEKCDTFYINCYIYHLDFLLFHFLASYYALFPLFWEPFVSITLWKLTYTLAFIVIVFALSQLYMNTNGAMAYFPCFALRCTCVVVCKATSEWKISIFLQ